MSPHHRVGAALRRVATITSIVRTRTEDQGRVERHGGLNGHFTKLEDKHAGHVEKTAIDLEKLIA